MTLRTWLFMISIVWLLAPPAAHAQEAGAAAEEEREPLNEVAVVLGGTRERAEDETSLTLGAEYERRLTRRLGIVAELEHVNGPDSWVFAAPIVFRPAAGWKLFAGPGLERKPRESESSDDAADGPEEGRENLFLWRFGTGYAWEIAKRYVVGPSFYLDAIKEPDEWTRAFVFAFSVGIAF